MRCFWIRYYVFFGDWEEEEFICRSTRADALRHAKKQGYNKFTVKEIF